MVSNGGSDLGSVARADQTQRGRIRDVNTLHGVGRELGRVAGVLCILVALSACAFTLESTSRITSAGPKKTLAETLEEFRTALAARDWADVVSHAVRIRRDFPDESPTPAVARELSEGLFNAGAFEESLRVCDSVRQSQTPGDNDHDEQRVEGVRVFCHLYLKDVEGTMAALVYLEGHWPELGAIVRERVGPHLEPRYEHRSGRVVLDYSGVFQGDPRFVSKRDELIREVSSQEAWAHELFGSDADKLADVPIVIRDSSPGMEKASTVEEIRGGRLGACTVLSSQALVMGSIPLVDVLRHESLHALHMSRLVELGRSIRSEPRWLVEGLATWGAGSCDKRIAELYPLAVTGPQDRALVSRLEPVESSMQMEYLRGAHIFRAIERQCGTDRTWAIVRRLLKGEPHTEVFRSEFGSPLESVVASLERDVEKQVELDLMGSEAYFLALGVCKSGDWDRGRKELSEFREDYPNSPFVSYALLYEARCAVACDDHVIGRVRFQQGAAKAPYSVIPALGELTEIEMLAKEGSWLEVKKRGEAYLRDRGNSSSRDLGEARTLIERARVELSPR